MKRLLAMLAAGLSVATIGLSVAAIGFPAAAQAATAPNDSFTSATVITSLPFTTNEDTSQATSDPSDPSGCSNNGSVWFSFTPSSDMQIDADASASNYGTRLSAWTGTQGALNQVACNDFSNQSSIIFAATAGTTYYFMAAQCCGSGGDGGGNLQFSVSQVIPPGNDDFASATPVGALPFSDTQDLSTATAEPAEPQPGCFNTSNTSNTVWYSFTAQTTESVTATTDRIGAGIAAYTGSSLANLSRVGCAEGFISSPLTFRVQAGTTYYFQVAAWCCDGFSPVTFHLEVTPSPVAQFSYEPGDPNPFDSILFFDNSNDPGGAGIASWAWDFGDGATATQQISAHRYAADGDYTVSLTVTTTDGRTASTSQVVQVRTHDVAITRLAVPTSAHVGKTISVTAYLQNTRYPETVQVDLSKGIPAGFSQVGSLTESVPVKRAGQTTRFAFSYTVTSDDKAIGKITFEVTASIIGFPDALPADNTLLSHLVKVG
jgi:PKD repeat protein